MSESATHDAIEAVARDSYGRLVAYIASRTGDIADAHDALSEALVAALETWPRNGVPDKPEAWLLHVARNRLIDASRREQTRRDAEPLLLQLAGEAESSAKENEFFPDERLKLLVNAMDDKNFAAAVKATGRKKLIVAGVTNDVCTVYPALSLVRESFEVQVVADAAGSPTKMSDDISLRRMERGDVTLTTTNQLIADDRRHSRQRNPSLFWRSCLGAFRRRRRGLHRH